MTNKHQKLELTWIGKDEQPRLEPRILIEDPERSYGVLKHQTTPNPSLSKEGSSQGGEYINDDTTKKPKGKKAPLLF